MSTFSDEASEIIDRLLLNSDAMIRFRRRWTQIIELAAEHDHDLLVSLLGYPENLPDLENLRPPSNRKPQGVSESFFARRSRGQLPNEIFLA